MITGALTSKAGSFFKRLETRGEHAAQQRAQYLGQALNSAQHRWRSAAALWPDLGLE